jgi:hypothetical protein
MRRTLLAAAVIAAAFAIPSAQADVIFTLGNNPQPNELNIFFAAKEFQTSAPDTIHGVVGQQTNEVVDFSSQNNPLYQNAQGQADIENDLNPGKALLTDLEITVPGFSWTDFIMNPLNGEGDATVTVKDNMNHVFDYDLGNGQNYLTMTTANGETMTEIDISMSCTNPGPPPTPIPGCISTGTNANLGFLQFKQPRISGVASTTDVPEPTSLAVLAAALLGLGFSIRTRRSS